MTNLEKYNTLHEMLLLKEDDEGEGILVGGMGGRALGGIAGGIAGAKSQWVKNHLGKEGGIAGAVLMGAEAGGIFGELGGYLQKKYKTHKARVGSTKKAALLTAQEAQEKGSPQLASHYMKIAGRSRT